VLINVPEGRLAEWRASPVIGVRLVANPQRVYPGRVREIAPTADVTTRTFNVRIAVQEADDDVKLGLTANVIVTNPGAPRDLIVPLAALGEREGKPALWVVDTKALTVSPIAVETGAYREDGVVIRSGIVGGETVVIAGVQKLVVGQAVRLTKP
jgi:membrane fusion protein, multidrug efflux system